MQFYDTYQCLAAQIGYYGHDMSYKTWLRKDDSLKASYLFVNFYPAVQNAWNRKKTFRFIDEAEAVSLVLQYLQKNVDKIKHDSKRYTKSYIYTVCVNCMAILHWRKCDRERSEKEGSFVFEQDGQEFDVISICADESEEEYNLPEFEYECESVFDVVSSMGIKYEKLATVVSSGESNFSKTRKSNPNYEKNPLASVSVSRKDVDWMMDDIRSSLSVYIVNNRPDLLKYVIGYATRESLS